MNANVVDSRLVPLQHGGGARCHHWVPQADDLVVAASGDHLEVLNLLEVEAPDAPAELEYVRVELAPQVSDHHGGQGVAAHSHDGVVVGEQSVEIL